MRCRLRTAGPLVCAALVAAWLRDALDRLPAADFACRLKLLRVAAERPSRSDLRHEP